MISSFIVFSECKNKFDLAFEKEKVCACPTEMDVVYYIKRLDDYIIKRIYKIWEDGSLKEYELYFDGELKIRPKIIKHKVNNIKKYFREVKRPAKFGERIRVTDAKLKYNYNHYKNGNEFTVKLCHSKGVTVWEEDLYINNEEYVVIEQICEINHKKYRSIKRKARLGDLVIILDGELEDKVYEVIDLPSDSTIVIVDEDNNYHNIFTHSFKILEPLYD